MSNSSQQGDAASDGLIVHIAAIALYTLVAFLSTWPLLRYATSRLPIGNEEARTVPLLNDWTIWCNADRLAHGGGGYWDAPIFYPERNTFAFSEPQPMTALVAPVIWLTGSRILAYNVYLWLSLVLNGWLVQILLRWLGLRRTVAIGAGIAMVLLPIAHWQMGVLQLVPLWGILWTWLAFAKIAFAEPGPRTAKEIAWRGGELGLAFTAAFFSCVHHALFLAVLMLAATWTLGRKLMRPRTLATLCVAGVLAGLLAAPVVIHLRMMASEHGFTRTREVVEQLSLRSRDYGTVYGHTLISAQASDGRQAWLASPGWLKLIWAALGIYWGLTDQRRRVWTWFLVTVGLAAWVLSLGTHLNVAGWQPWHWLTAYVPGFAQVRSAYRFAYFVQIAIVIGAAQGVDRASSWAGAGMKKCPAESAARDEANNWRVRARLAAILFGVVIVAASGVAAVFDPWPLRLRLGVAPEVGPHRDWIGVLKTSSEPGAVLCLPMAGGDHVRDFEITTEWMMLGTYHGRSLVNGYSGFFPERYFKLREETWSGQLSDATLEQLYRERVRFVVLDCRRYRMDWSDGQRHGQIVVKLLQHSGSGIELYQLLPAAGR